MATPSEYGRPRIELNDKQILFDPQYRMIIRALEQRDHVDVLGLQRAVTLSGISSNYLPSKRWGRMKRLCVTSRVGPDDRTVSLGVFIGGREAATAVLRDKQTLLPLPAVKKVYANGVTARIFVRVAFVTVTIVDAAGNRVHAEEDEATFEGIWRF